MKRDYIVGKFEFLKMPTVLIKNDEYRKLSAKAKLIYMYCIHLFELSEGNSWKDKNGRTYVHLTVEKVQEILNVSNKTAIKVLEELENVDLIERYKQGLGKPNRIYIKDFRV